MKMGNFRELFMSSPSPMTLVHLEDGRVVEVNRSFTELTGFTREEILGRTSLELGILTEEDREKLREALQQEGRFRSMEITVGAKGGPRPALVSGEVVELDSVPHFLLVGTDIERQKVIEERYLELQAAHSVAQEVESKFRVIFDQSVELMGVLTLDGILQDVNRAALEMVGAHREDVVGKAFWDTPWWNHSTGLQENLKEWVERSARGEVVVYVADHPDQDGGVRTVEGLLAPMRDVSGSPSFLIAVGQDVTARVEAEKDLRESQERSEALLANIPDVTWIISRDGHTSFISPNVEAVLGFTPDEVCDPERDVWAERIHPGDLPEVKEAFELLFAEGEEFGREYRFKKKDGGWIWLRDRAVRTFETDGKEHAYGVSSEITEQRFLQTQLHQAQKLDTLGTLASGIAHDFNNLLVPILGYADLLREGVPADDPFRTELEAHLFDAAERARELVQQILTFSRSREPEKRPIHPEGPVKNALRLMGATLPSSIRLRRRFGGELGRFLGDGAQIQQVVVNFCTNAVHAMREGGGVLTVALESLEVSADFKTRNPNFSSERAVYLEFSDTGEGMDSTVMGRIFDPFFTTKKAGEGTGLGLSIVYGIVKGHDGVVEVESQPGKGATFRVFLPEIVTASSMEGVEGSEGVRGAESVLFVDDQGAIRDTAERLLKHLGYRVTLATGASDALEIFRRDPDAFDVVVTDYDMPRMTGVHLALELLEVKPDLPVVLITGSYPIQAKEGEALGIRRHLIKPFTASDLGKVIREALEMDPPGEGG
jgi:PAS domain S-box-containing protein